MEAKNLRSRWPVEGSTEWRGDGGEAGGRDVIVEKECHCYLGVLGCGTCSNPPDQVDITLSALVLWYCRKEHEM